MDSYTLIDQIINKVFFLFVFFDRVLTKKNSYSASILATGNFTTFSFKNRMGVKY